MMTTKEIGERKAIGCSSVYETLNHCSKLFGASQINRATVLPLTFRIHRQGFGAFFWLIFL